MVDEEAAYTALVAQSMQSVAEPRPADDILHALSCHNCNWRKGKRHGLGKCGGLDGYSSVDTIRVCIQVHRVTLASVF